MPPSLSQMNLQDWLSDPLGNDQFATLVDNVTEINVNNAGGERPQVRARRTVCVQTDHLYILVLTERNP